MPPLIPMRFFLLAVGVATGIRVDFGFDSEADAQLHHAQDPGSSANDAAPVTQTTENQTYPTAEEFYAILNGEKETAWMAGMSYNMILNNTKLAEDELRFRPQPVILSDESVQLAFQKRRVGNKGYFTSDRIMFKFPKDGGKKVTWISVPYTTVDAWMVETRKPGSQWKFWTSLPDMPTVFRLFGTERADVRDIDKVMSRQMLSNPADLKYTTQLNVSKDLDDGWVWQVGHAQVHADQAQTYLNTTLGGGGILGANEHVVFAVKHGYSMAVLTEYRLLLVDRLATDYNVKFTSFPWESINCFDVVVGGGQSEKNFWSSMRFFTTIIDPQREMKVWIRRDQADIFGMQSFIAARLSKTVNRIGHWQLPANQRQTSTANALLEVGQEFRVPTPKRYQASWQLGYLTPVPPNEARRTLSLFRGVPFENDEVIMKSYRMFRCFLIFTNWRMVILTTKPRNFFPMFKYETVPYRSIEAYAIKRAGSSGGVWKLNLWTSLGNTWDNNDIEGQIAKPFVNSEAQVAGLSYMNLRFRVDDLKNSSFETDMHQFISDRLLPTGPPIATQPVDPGKQIQEYNQRRTGGQWVPFIHPKHDPREYAEWYFNLDGTLLPSETLELNAWTNGRKMMLFTSERILEVVTYGDPSQEKFEYKSLPYSGLRGFRLEGGGGKSGKKTGRMKFLTSTKSWPSMTMDFGKLETTRRPEFEVAAFIAQKLSRNVHAKQPSQSSLLQQHTDSVQEPGSEPGWEGLKNKLAQNYGPQSVNPVLVEGEVINMARKSKNDKEFLLVTSLRIMKLVIVDNSGYRVKIDSFPLSSVAAWSAQEGEPKLTLWTSVKLREHRSLSINMAKDDSVVDFITNFTKLRLKE